MTTLDSELIVKAYLSGIFPMADEDGQISWYSPDPRCVIDFDEFHASHRLLRTYRQHPFELKIDTKFNEVIKACAKRGMAKDIGPHTSHTWISDQIIQAFEELHKLGIAHSVEAYADGKLVGGLYGVALGGAFMGESMFHDETDASKICLVFLIERLKERGYVLLDCQYLTEHLAKFGAKLISREEYLVRLTKATSLSCQFN